jgi:hypothetical protein
MRDHPSRELARFAAELRFDDIPLPVVRRAEDLLLDWFASALAGKGARAVESIERFALAMGPSAGDAEVLISRRRTSPYFAAMVNAAASHFAEQDDVHNGSVFHPGAVVFPPALAMVQASGRSGRPAAAASPDEVGIQVESLLGLPHSFIRLERRVRVAAAAAGRNPRLVARANARCFRRQERGRRTVEFLRDAADSKQLPVSAADGGFHLARDGSPGRSEFGGRAGHGNIRADPAPDHSPQGTLGADRGRHSYHACWRHTSGGGCTAAGDDEHDMPAVGRSRDRACTRVRRLLGPVVNPPNRIRRVLDGHRAPAGLIATSSRIARFATISAIRIAIFRDKVQISTRSRSQRSGALDWPAGYRRHHGWPER